MSWPALLAAAMAMLALAVDTASGCSRVPPGTTAAKSPVDENYVVSLAGNPQTYVPGQRYNVSLNAYNGMTFISFMLALESEAAGADGGSVDAMGTFEISDLAETRFSPRCANLVENTNTNVKTRAEVTWVAPPSTGNGCVLLRATVAQHRDVWFMDDGFLTKRICEEEIDDIDSQPSVMDPCCACDEAKYELTFEGKWSRHTHPKDFPANSWRTRFSDIIGASHTIDYRFWRYGDPASEGLREVAEHGSTRTLESELKDQSAEIRTIIKARGIAYPNVTGRTFAVFRVDSKHHLISLVSMIDPSPDWIVGVSGLELCLPNCSWVESKVHNLYPWDAGTDSGPSYMSADQPQVPADVIRRIKSNFPNDPRSPFYDSAGAPMKPLATLHINRRRLYEKTCENTDSEDDPVECATHPWGRWNECSARCGPGKQYRTREFKNTAQAHRTKCRKSLREEQSCTGRKCGSFNEDDAGGPNGGGAESNNNYDAGDADLELCALSEWSEWSSCSSTCGVGIQVRTRQYLNRRAMKECKAYKDKLQDYRACEGDDCSGDIGNGNAAAQEADDPYDNNNDENGNGNGNANDADFKDELQFVATKSLYGLNKELSSSFRNFQSYSQKREDYVPPVCGVTDWSDFSPCIGPCGAAGQRQRERKVWNNDEVYEVPRPAVYDDPCRHVKRVEYVNCTNPSCDAIVPSYCYESLQVSPCRDSETTNFWYYDHMSDQCALFWADKCDSNRNKFKSKELCESSCRQPRQRSELQSANQERAAGLEIELERQPIDCVVSEWAAHVCNATCGEGVQVKTRKVLRSPRYGGKPCPKHLVRLEKCYQRCDDIYSIGGGGVYGGYGGYGGSGGLGDRRRGGGGHGRHPAPVKNECRYSEWSAWTPCTASCGDNAVRQKTRTLFNTDLSYKCKDRVRIEKCIMMPCLLNSNDESDRW